MDILCSYVPLKFLLWPAMYTNLHIAAPFFKEYFIFNNILLNAHIAAAIPAILFGPILFEPNFRKSRPDWHRFLGSIYVAGCLLSAVLVIPLAMNNAGTYTNIGKFGFTIMALTWLATPWFATTWFA